MASGCLTYIWPPKSSGNSSFRQEKISSRFFAFDTLSMVLYYKQFSSTVLQFIRLHQTYIEAQHFSGFQMTNHQNGQDAFPTAIENTAYPFTGQSSSRLRRFANHRPIPPVQL